MIMQKGFTNFAAPGADRFKISVKLAKKSLDDFEDTNFVELMKVDIGSIKKIRDDTLYAEILRYFAKRTYDESGDYAVDPFRVSIEESLNNEIDQDGLFTDDRLTYDGNVPDDDTCVLKVLTAKPYVRGFDVDLSVTSVLDVDKPRDTKNIRGISVPFEMGSLVRVNNAQGLLLLVLVEQQEISFNFMVIEKVVVILLVVLKWVKQEFTFTL